MNKPLCGAVICDSIANIDSNGVDHNDNAITPNDPITPDGNTIVEKNVNIKYISNVY